MGVDDIKDFLINGMGCEGCDHNHLGAVRTAISASQIYGEEALISKNPGKGWPLGIGKPVGACVPQDKNCLNMNKSGYCKQPNDNSACIYGTYQYTPEAQSPTDHNYNKNEPCLYPDTFLDRCNDKEKCLENNPNNKYISGSTFVCRDKYILPISTYNPNSEILKLPDGWSICTTQPVPP